jgi:homogentisate 1,2-dioxygenase
VSIPATAWSEPDETFFVNFTNQTNATLGDTDAQATITDVAVSNSGKDATFFDADGDRVTVRSKQRGAERGELRLRN